MQMEVDKINRQRLLWAEEDVSTLSYLSVTLVCCSQELRGTGDSSSHESQVCEPLCEETSPGEWTGWRNSVWLTVCFLPPPAPACTGVAQSRCGLI